LPPAFRLPLPALSNVVLADECLRRHRHLHSIKCGAEPDRMTFAKPECALLRTTRTQIGRANCWRRSETATAIIRVLGFDSQHASDLSSTATDNHPEPRRGHASTWLSPNPYANNRTAMNGSTVVQWPGWIAQRRAGRLCGERRLLQRFHIDKPVIHLVLQHPVKGGVDVLDGDHLAFRKDAMLGTEVLMWSGLPRWRLTLSPIPDTAFPPKASATPSGYITCSA
jgi:hypothetical protein